MIKIENTEVYGWEAAIRGMRNPMNSWAKSDSNFNTYFTLKQKIGENDLELMKKLVSAGTDHSKFMRMINVTCDITAPMYWWKEFDAYKVGTVRNSCSTMHKIHEKEFALDDFSHEHLFGNGDMLKFDGRDNITNDDALAAVNVDGDWCYFTPKGYIQMTCNILNCFREKYLKTKYKKYWWQMIQLLPSSYNQRATVQLNYQVIKNMYHARKNHKLDEWRDFCKWIENLPYSELITGGPENEDNA